MLADYMSTPGTAQPARLNTSVSLEIEIVADVDAEAWLQNLVLGAISAAH
jgi:hypothetical protein